MAPPERTNNLRLLVSDEELAMAKALADVDGVPVSHVVRQLLRQAYVGRFGDKKPKAKR